MRKMGGCYDHRRRVATQLVRGRYLKERRFQDGERRIIRSLRLTEKGLGQIQHLSPNRAA